MRCSKNTGLLFSFLTNLLTQSFFSQLNLQLFEKRERKKRDLDFGRFSFLSLGFVAARGSALSQLSGSPRFPF